MHSCRRSALPKEIGLTSVFTSEIRCISSRMVLCKESVSVLVSKYISRCGLASGTRSCRLMWLRNTSTSLWRTTNCSRKASRRSASLRCPPQKLLISHNKGSDAGLALTWAVRSSWNGSGSSQRRSPTPSSCSGSLRALGVRCHPAPPQTDDIYPHRFTHSKTTYYTDE